MNTTIKAEAMTATAKMVRPQMVGTLVAGIVIYKLVSNLR